MQHKTESNDRKKEDILDEIKKLRARSNEDWIKLHSLALTPQEAKQFKQDLTAFVTSNYLLISYPEILFNFKKVCQELAKEANLTPIDFILQRFKEESREILTKSGYPDDLDELQRLEKKGSLKITMPARWVIKVLSSIIPIQEAIRNNDAKRAVMETITLMCAAIGAQRYSLDKREIKLKLIGPVMGGMADKKYYGIISAIEQALKNNKAGNAYTIWRYFKKNHKGENNSMEIDDYEIYFYEDITGEEENLLFQKHINGKERSMKYSTFERHVNSIKKKLH